MRLRGHVCDLLSGVGVLTVLLVAWWEVAGVLLFLIALSLWLANRRRSIIESLDVKERH